MLPIRTRLKKHFSHHYSPQHRHNLVHHILTSSKTAPLSCSLNYSTTNFATSSPHHYIQHMTTTTSNTSPPHHHHIYHITTTSPPPHPPHHHHITTAIFISSPPPHSLSHWYSRHGVIHSSWH